MCGFLTQRLRRFGPVNDTVPIVWKDMWVPVLVWTGVGDLASTRIQSPDRPVRSKSLYWLRFSGPQIFKDSSIFVSHLLTSSELQTDNFVASGCVAAYYAAELLSTEFFIWLRVNKCKYVEVSFVEFQYMP
jgi:hypothetical protein